jgi:hypothetical protein
MMRPADPEAAAARFAELVLRATARAAREQREHLARLRPTKAEKSGGPPAQCRGEPRGGWAQSAGRRGGTSHDLAVVVGAAVALAVPARLLHNPHAGRRPSLPALPLRGIVGSTSYARRVKETNALATNWWLV